MARACSCCSGCSVLLVILATGLFAAGVATDEWINTTLSTRGLFTGFDLDDPGAGLGYSKNDIGIAVRSCAIACLAVVVILILTYFSHCCCSDSQRGCLLCVQFLLQVIVVAAAAGCVIVHAWQRDWKNDDFGWSYYLAAAGGALYAINLLIILADVCCGRREDWLWNVYELNCIDASELS